MRACVRSRLPTYLFAASSISVHNFFRTTSSCHARCPSRAKHCVIPRRKCTLGSVIFMHRSQSHGRSCARHIKQAITRLLILSVAYQETHRPITLLQVDVELANFDLYFVVHCHTRARGDCAFVSEGPGARAKQSESHSLTGLAFL